MLKAFNDLSASGSAHALNNKHEINTSEQGLKNPQAIHWCIILKEIWETFPPAEQTFDTFYKKIFKYIINYKTLSSG